jgi:DNA-binding NarL/FixJ family response regulator
MAQTLRILLADDNAAVVQLVTRMLQKNFIVAGAVSNGAAVLSLAPDLKPDVIILDVSLGDSNGFEICRQLKADQCTSKIIFLTIHQELDFVRAGFDAGASGYVYKSRIGSDLLAAIDAVQFGKVFMPDVDDSQ